MSTPTAAVDVDGPAAASHRAMTAHLTGPLQAGAVASALPVSAAGTVQVGGPTRHPLLLASPESPLDGATLELTVERPDATTSLLTFAPGTEPGAALPLYRPPADPATGTAGPFQVRLRLVRIAGDNPARRAVIPLDAIADHVRIELVEGVTGHLLYLLGAEKQRLRRQARELARIRTLPGAHGDALDRLGAELGVPRFTDTIGFRPPAAEDGAAVFGAFPFGGHDFGTGVPGEVTSVPRREPDEEYRRRLAVYRPWLYPTVEHIRAVLNGPGADSDPNAGLLGSVGVTERVTVTDTPRVMAAAVHLVGVGPAPAAAQLRQGFADLLRATVLVWPSDGPAAEAAHAGRFLPASAAEHTARLRARLRESVLSAAATAMAPQLAEAVDRLTRCRRALGQQSRIRLTRAQDLTGGSRYELGLGADLVPQAAAVLDAMAERLRAHQSGGGPGTGLDLPDRPTDAEPDPDQTRAVLAAAVPAGSGQDPDGAWLLHACGLSTVHRVDDRTLYVSHVPTFGLVVDGGHEVRPGDELPLAAHYHAAGEPGSHVLIVEGVAGAARAWADLGHEPWTVLDAADAEAAWRRAQPMSDDTAAVVQAAGMPRVIDPADLARGLGALPAELLATLRLDPAQARRVTTGRPEAVSELQDLARLLSEHGLSSVLVLVLGPDEAVVVTAGVALPLAGLNLAQRAAARFRWYAVRLWSARSRPARPGLGARESSVIDYLGARTVFRPARPGLYAVVALGQVRLSGGGEPYELAVDLPDGATLDLLQYEYLMNVLAHVHPMGTRVDTSAIRAAHVDLDGDGVADPLTSAVSRTYRAFRRPGSRGTART